MPKGGKGIEPILHENSENISLHSDYFLRKRGEEVNKGGGSCLSLSENNLTQLSFCNFFFMQKSCGQFVDVSDLNLVVCYLI